MIEPGPWHMLGLHALIELLPLPEINTFLIDPVYITPFQLIWILSENS